MKPVLGMLIPGLFLFFFISCAHGPLEEYPVDEGNRPSVSDTAPQSDDSDVRDPDTAESDDIPGNPVLDDSASSAEEPLATEPDREDAPHPIQVSNDSTESSESTEEDSEAAVLPGDGSFLPPLQNPGGQKKNPRDKEPLEKVAAEGAANNSGEDIPEMLSSDESSSSPLNPLKSRPPGEPSKKADNPLTVLTPDISSDKETVPEDESPEDIKKSEAQAARTEVPVEVLNPLLSEDIPIEQGRHLQADSTSSAESEPAAVSEPLESTSPSGDGYPGVQVQVIEENPERFSGGAESLLPEENATQPSRWLDAPGEFTVTLDGRGWVFRSDLSSPGSWRFLERERDGESTRFRFLFDEKGQWSLVFERQDLSSGGSLRETRTVKVGDGESAIIENGPPGLDGDSGVPGILPGNPDERDSMARLAAETGRPDEAMALWERDAGRKDAAGRRARKGLIEQAIDAAAVHALVDWLPSYLEDGADPALLSKALNLLQEHAGYQSLETAILEQLVTGPSDPRRPEWLYRLARLLEEPGEGRNLDRAGALYTEVIEGWPYSDWSDLSEERLAWLRRYYFRVR